jgi:alkylation response protein AidB-like acyl-CoA dehydrogenase
MGGPSSSPYAEIARLCLFAVWNTEREQGVRLIKQDGGMFRLDGAKIFASGAGVITHPLITARNACGEVLMLVRRPAPAIFPLARPWDALLGDGKG